VLDPWVIEKILERERERMPHQIQIEIEEGSDWSTGSMTVPEDEKTFEVDFEVEV
jgi:hypothetical protein